MTKLFEATVTPHYAGFGMYQRGEVCPVDWARDLSDWTDYMGREYEWRWAEELDGIIYDQNNGKPFAWRVTENDEWAYGLIYAETEDED